jgi:hypothetical protein
MVFKGLRDKVQLPVGELLPRGVALIVSVHNEENDRERDSDIVDDFSGDVDLLSERLPVLEKRLWVCVRKRVTLSVKATVDDVDLDAVTPSVIDAVLFHHDSVNVGEAEKADVFVGTVKVHVVVQWRLSVSERVLTIVRDTNLVDVAVSVHEVLKERIEDIVFVGNVELIMFETVKVTV